MKYLLSIIITIFAIQFSHAQESLSEADINIQWGKGYRCTGRAICSIQSPEVGLKPIGKLHFDSDGNIVKITIPNKNLTTREAVFLFRPGTIEVDKSSELTVDGKKFSVLAGRYPVTKSEEVYIITFQASQRSSE